MSSSKLLFSIIEEQARRAPGSPALLAPNRPACTYRQLSDHILSVVGFLRKAGLRRGDRVAVVLPNGPEMAEAFLSVSSACTCAPLNPAYSADEFTFYLTDLNARALMLPESSDSPARGVATKLNIPVLELASTPETPAGLFTLTAPSLAGGGFDFAELDDVALVLHTSGTTSRPKIVPLSHENIFHSVNNIAQTYSLGPADRVLNMMPLFHIHGLMGALSATLASGGSIICAPGLRQNEVLDWLVDLAPTWYSAVPTIHQAVLEIARSQPEKTTRVKLRFMRSSSSSMPPQVAQDLEAVFRAPLLEAYGMTEATHQMASNPLPPRPHKFGSVGLPTGVTQIHIIDEAGQALPANTLGEIAIFGPNVTKGYENNPTANASAFSGAWLRTGDRGYLDDDGYLFIQGRLKEIINRGGEKIAPREIDDVLLQHPAVGQAVTFSMPHPTLGEDVAAAVVLREGQAVNARELRQFSAEKLADFKVPRIIIFLKEIPKGATGKIQRIGLADKLRVELETIQAGDSDDAPKTEIQKEIAAMMSNVLGLESVGLHDDFLELGGDSIRAVRLLAKINERFGLSLTIRDLFDKPNVAEITTLVKK